MRRLLIGLGMALSGCLSLGETAEETASTIDGSSDAKVGVTDGGWGATKGDASAGETSAGGSVSGGNGGSGGLGGAAGAPSSGGGASSGGGGAPSCPGGKADCNSNASDGCETDLLISTSNCGACGTVCSVPHATAACAAGLCTIASCQTTFANCDGNPGNGCETVLDTTQNCGACGVACAGAPVNGFPKCSNGSCGIGCDATWGNCDNNPTNGCETQLTSDGANCGFCGAKCSTYLVCSGGKCKLPG